MALPWRFIVLTILSASLLTYYVYDSALPPGFSDYGPYLFSGIFKLSLMVADLADFLGFEGNYAVTRFLAYPGVIIAPKFDNIDNYYETVAEVPVKVYQPKNAKGPTPGVVYYHGGGFHIGSVDCYHDITLRLSNDLQAVVMSVDYRLAPQHIFPAAPDDCFQATKYFIKNAKKYNVDPNRIVVMGDSAGGNLAAGVAIRLRDEGVSPMPRLQVLIYPVIQLLDIDLPSDRFNAKGPVVTREHKSTFTSLYLFGDMRFRDIIHANNVTSPARRKKLRKTIMNLDILPNDMIKTTYGKEDLTRGDTEFWKKYKKLFDNPVSSPLLAKSLEGVPPAYISSCQYDMLRDDAFFYAQRLREANVPVEHINLDLCYHGWLGACGVSREACQYFADVTKAMNKVLSK